MRRSTPGASADSGLAVTRVELNGPLTEKVTPITPSPVREVSSPPMTGSPPSTELIP